MSPRTKRDIDGDLVIAGNLTVLGGLNEKNFLKTKTDLVSTKEVVNSFSGRIDSAESKADAASSATYNYANNVAPTNNVTELVFTSEANADGSVDVGVSFKYTQGSVPAAGFLIYAKSGPTEPVNILASDQAAKFVPASADAGEQTYGASLQALSVRYGGAGALPRVYHFAVVAVSQCVGGTIPHNAGLVEASGWTAKVFVATIMDIAIKSYRGQGVNRRAIKIDAESLDWLDAPDTTPAYPELLRARIGRLGVGGAILMDGDFQAQINNMWTNVSVINSASSQYPAYIQLINGELRVAYVRNINGYIYERIWDGDSWGSESVVNSASSQSPAYIQLNSGELRIAYVRNSDSYIVERIWNGDSWGSETVINAAGSSYPAYIQLDSGELRVAYTRTSDSYIVERIWNGTSWGSESVINAASSQYAEYIQLGNGELRIAYVRSSNGYIVERVWNGDSWGSETVVNAANSSYPAYIQLINGELRIAYLRGSDKYIFERIWEGDSWGSEEVVSATSSESPTYIQLSSGELRIAYAGIGYVLVERTLKRYARIGAGVVEHGIDSDGFNYVVLGDGTKVFLEPIIGSNSNGSYIKFGDGTMMQWGSWSKSAGTNVFTVTLPSTTAYLDTTYSVNIILTINTDSSLMVSTGVRSKTTSSFVGHSVYTTDLNTFITGASSGTWSTIGRWK